MWGTAPFVGAALVTAAVALGSVAAPHRAFAEAAGNVSPQIDGTRIANADSEPGSWLSVGRGYHEDHFSPLTEITADTIGRLKLAWYYDLDTTRGQEATPLFADGILYTSSAWSKVFAFDGVTGKPLWSYDPEIAGKKGFESCCDVVNRGVALWNGKVYVGALDGRLIALDAKTGRPVWSVQTTDTSRPYSITGAPRVANGKVLIGNAGGEYGVRGYVSAYDAETGKLAWRFFTAPNPDGRPDGAASDAIFAKLANATWGKDGQWKQVGGGGTVWDTIVYDPDLKQVLIGTSNGTPWSHRTRSGDDGDNLFLSSIVALDPDTGAYKWHYQEVPGEEWDYDATGPMVQTDMQVDGKPRKVLFQAAKDGFFYVIDRTNGRPISATPFSAVNWADGYDETTWRPKVRSGARYSENGGDFHALPGALGAHSWQPIAYSPKTGLVYVPAQEVPDGYRDDAHFRYVPGRMNMANVSPELMGPQSPAERAALKAMTKGSLLAWDPIAKRTRFAIEHSGPGYGGVLATAGNLIFQGGPDGSFTAWTADAGKRLWSFDAQNGVMGGPMSFSAEGRQYIAVMVGLGGGFGVYSPYAPQQPQRPKGRVLVFALDGRAELPPFKPVSRPAQVPAETWPGTSVAKGKLLYAGNCAACHGPAANSSGVLPDLRRSAVLPNRDAWNAVLMQGALESRGMLNFSRWISAEDVDAIRAYIADQARVLQRAEAGTAATP